MSTRTEKDRAYNTEYARQRRARQVAAANANAVRCQALLARGHPCRTPLRSRFVAGETVPFCPTCDRKANGICIRCTVAPVEGTPRRALYCALCRKLRIHESLERYKKTHRREERAKHKRRMADPVKRADRLVYKKLQRALIPTKIAQYKKAYYEKHKEHVRAYMAAYREARREKNRERERLRNAGALPDRACLTCPTIITGRAKKCDVCKRAQRQHARAAISARMERAA